MTTIGSENLTNGPSKSERFGGKYRGARRDTVLTEVVAGDPEREEAAEHSASAINLPSLEPNSHGAANFPASWSTEPGDSLVDHPLLQGLLLELPPKGSLPPPGWLDRWFEATRAILELLYMQGAGRPR
ncbi:hypothetical protein D7147_29605 [Micromonospora musae]|uniref:Uncharacterized protein n=1 Tax=Micromonospora musae TaxID=1894970 RepID=A0A3A9XXH9_9ACTN|nr:hypothetical protein [Micromonospora musae]RKN14001.1 hypothetical protein D7147_29605 [Micromonospora musae]RKN29482.1 hypothetical protein D7044_21755 [Micromonospora musae]